MRGKIVPLRHTNGMRFGDMLDLCACVVQGPGGSIEISWHLVKKNALLQGHPRLMESESVFYQEAEMTFIHINVGEESIRVHRTDLWER